MPNYSILVRQRRISDATGCETAAGVPADYASLIMREEQEREVQPPFLCRLMNFFGLENFIIRKYFLGLPEHNYRVTACKDGRLDLIHDEGAVLDDQVADNIWVKKRIGSLADGPNYLYLGEHPASRKLVLYCHGKSSTLWGSYNFFVEFYLKFKVDFLTFDYTDAGDGSASQASLIADADKVLRFAKEELGYPSSDIILVGFSIGSIPALQLSASREVGGCLLLAPLASFYSVFSSQTQSFKNEVLLNNLVRIQKSRCRMLLLHGQGDQVVPCANSKKLLQWFLRGNPGRERRIRLFLAGFEGEASMTHNALPSMVVHEGSELFQVVIKFIHQK